MLLHDAALSYLHFIFAFILVGALVAEAFILRLPIDGRAARLLLRVDLFYGVSSVGIILAGIARVVWGAKGYEYFLGQPFFWAKMAVFAVIGLISILPTMTFLRWVKQAGEDAALEAKRSTFSRAEIRSSKEHVGERYDGVAAAGRVRSDALLGRRTAPSCAHARRQGRGTTLACGCARHREDAGGIGGIGTSVLRSFVEIRFCH